MGATFVVTLREAFEAALLLGIVYAYLERVGARTEYRWVTLGGVLGLVASVAAALGWAIFRGGRQLSLPRFFGVTSVLLLVVAAGLFSTGIGKLIGLGFIPAADPLWDTSWLLRDDSVVGGFLSGLTGYRARPTAPEVIGYVGYLVGAGLLFFTPRTPRAETPDREAARPSAR